MYVFAQICRVEVNIITYELVEYATGILKNMLLASTKRQREGYSPIMAKQSSVMQQQTDSAD